MKPLRKNPFLAAFLSFSLAAPTAYAASQTWGTNAATAWYNGVNWAGGAFPGLQGAAASNTDIATFTNAATATSFGINMNADTVYLNLGAISLDSTRAAATTIGNSSTTAIPGNGQVLRLYGATVNAVGNTILRNAGSGLLTIQNIQGSGNQFMGVALGNTSNNINIDGAGGITISSIISEINAGSGLTKGGTGSGTLILSGANTYTGATNVNAGTVQISNATSLGTTFGNTVIASGGRVSIQTSTLSVAEAFTISGTGTTATNGALNFGGSATGINVTGAITLGAAARIQGDGSTGANLSGGIDLGGNTLTYNTDGGAAHTISTGAIIGAGGSLTKSGGGTLTLSGATANTYSGLTTVSGGTLALNKSAGNAIAGNVLINGASSTFLSNTTSNQIADTATVTFNSAFSNWNLNGNTETVATLTMTSAAPGADAGLVTGTTGNLTVTGTLTHTSGGITLSNGGTNSISAGTLIINTGNSSWTFGTTGGAKSLVIGSGGLTIGGGSTLNANGASNFISLGGNVTSQSNTNPNIISGIATLRLNATRTFDVADGGAASDLTVSTIIANGSGTSGITKTGAGTLTLGAANTYTGTTTIDGGVLAIATSGAIANNASNAININNTGTLSMGREDTWGTAPLIPITIAAGGAMTNSGSFFNTLGALTLNGGTLTSTGGRNTSFGSWALAGTVTVGGSSASAISQAGTNAQINLGAVAVTNTQFNVADATGTSAADLTVSATLQNGRSGGGSEQASSLTKTGAGTMVLTGANTYSGGTSVTAGTLIAQTSDTALGTAAVNVGASGTLQINHDIAAGTTFAIANAITGSGTLEFAGTSALSTGNRRLTTVGSLTGFTGGISILANGNYFASTASNTANQNLTIASGGYMTMSANNGFGKLDGAGTVMRNIVADTVNLTLGNNDATGGNFSGAIIAPGLFGSTGNIAVIKVGSGTQTFSGANTYLGGTSIKAGTLALVNGNNRLAAAGTVTLGDVATTGKLVLGDATAASNQTLAGLFSDGLGGSVVGANATTDSVLTLNMATSNTFGGTLGGGGTNENKLALTKTGTGSLTLSGANTYTGDTLVSAGSLYVTGSLASNVTVSDFATLGGGGTVLNVTFGGDSIFDILQAVGGNPLDSSAISFAATGFGIDNLVSNGAAINWGTIADGTYTLITGTLDETNLANFGFANAFNIGGNRKAYFAEGSLQLVVVPEPSTALLGALGLIALLRRRRN